MACIEKIHAAEGEVIASEALLATFAAGAAAGETAAVASPAPAQTVASADTAAAAPDMGPAARQLVEEHKLDARLIPGTGKGGRITKEDVLAYLDGAVTPEPAPAAQGATPAAAAAADTLVEVPHGPSSERVEKRVPMTRMRARIAERLLEATQQTAMLTTFNEVNMAPVMALRSKYKDQFEKTHNGTRLGFMGFFVKAACEALKRYPAVNASIDGNDVVYHGYQDIGVAVSTEDGLVVPVLRDADFMSLADVEAAIATSGPGRAEEQAHHRGHDRRHVYGLQRRRVWLSDEHADPESAADRHPWHAQDPGTPHGRGWRDRGPADDVPGPVLRSPPHRRQDRGAVPGGDQGPDRRSGAHPAAALIRAVDYLIRGIRNV
jgi:pyruvate/2-oxoglutarate dehydrogenase complex dihydrolipoamide acyltransferase (E2) component